VPEIDADTELDAPVFAATGVAVDDRTLDLCSAAHRVDNAGKFHQDAVAGGLDDPPTVLSDLRINELTAQRLEAFERTFLVRPHQPRISRDIGGEDRGKTAGRGHNSGTPCSEPVPKDTVLAHRQSRPRRGGRVRSAPS